MEDGDVDAATRLSVLVRDTSQLFPGMLHQSLSQLCSLLDCEIDDVAANALKALTAVATTCSADLKDVQEDMQPQLTRLMTHSSIIRAKYAATLFCRLKFAVSTAYARAVTKLVGIMTGKNAAKATTVRHMAHACPNTLFAIERSIKVSCTSWRTDTPIHTACLSDFICSRIRAARFLQAASALSSFAYSHPASFRSVGAPALSFITDLVRRAETGDFGAGDAALEFADLLQMSLKLLCNHVRGLLAPDPLNGLLADDSSSVGTSVTERWRDAQTHADKLVQTLTKVIQVSVEVTAPSQKAMGRIQHPYMPTRSHTCAPARPSGCTRRGP